MPSAYEQHCDKWRDGCGADICPLASRRCYARGSLPCDALFVGEAPGESEDCFGKPFAGPAGHLLDSIVRSALGLAHKSGTWCPRCGKPCKDKPAGVTCPAGHAGLVRREDFVPHPRFAFTNLVLCIPRDEAGGKAGEPSVENIKACSERLIELVAMARPKLIVTVGTLARDWLDPKAHPRHRVAVPVTIPQESIRHPAAILRDNYVMRTLNAQRCAVTLADAFREHL